MEAVHGPRARPRRPAARLAAGRVPLGSALVEERSAEERRRLRLSSPPVAFIGGLLVLAAIVAAVILVIWAVSGFGEGSEGAFA